MKAARLSLILIISLLISLSLFAQADGNRHLGVKSITAFKLPASNNSGLIDIVIEWQPRFRIDQYETGIVLLLHMNVVMSRATDMRGTFSYHYSYYGERYTDQQVGKAVFEPIRLSNIELNLIIHGPDAVIRQVKYNSNMQEQIVLRMPGKHKASDFTVFIQNMESVAFNGTQQIEQAIIDLRMAHKKKQEDAIQQERNRAEAEKAAHAKAAAEKQKADRLAQAKKDDNEAQKKTKTAEDEFWGVKKGESVEKSEKTLPEVIASKDGKYYMKDGNNKYVEIGQDDYYRIKTAKDQETKRKLAVEEQAKKEADHQAMMAQRERSIANEAAHEKINQDFERKISLIQQGIAAGRVVDETKSALRENSNLSGNYQSVDQLMAEFNQKMANVKQLTTELTAQRNNELNYAVNARFNQPGYEATIGEGMKLIGGILNSAKAAKERKLAQEQLQLQKQLALNRIAEEEKKLLINIRTDLFKQFKETPLPNSSSKVSATTIYYFVYAYEPAQLGLKNASLYLSNVFPISRYGDGTWPLRTSLTESISKLTPLGEILHGYYTNEQEAEAMQQAMAEVFRQTGGSILFVTLKGKKGASGISNGDFWETGKPKTDSSTTKPTKKDDFWNN